MKTNALAACGGIPRRLVRALHAVALAALVTSAVSVRAATPDGAIRIEAFQFQPGAMEVPRGTTVRWQNGDDEPHTVTFLDGSGSSPALDTDDTWSRRFDAPGTYAYHCALHPQMSGTVVVR